jgi:hypothetical protein
VPFTAEHEKVIWIRNSREIAMPPNGVESAADRARSRGAERVRGHLRLVAGGADASPHSAAPRGPDAADAQPPNDDDASGSVGFTLLTW